jgi:hypothetical protein
MAECLRGDIIEQCTLAQKYIHPIYSGLDHSAVAAWIKASVWIVPWSGALHLLALGLLGGAILIVDMRVLGGGLTSQTPARLNRLARPLTLIALALAIPSGLIMAFGEMMKIYYSPPYWVKMASLAAALTFTFGVRNRLIASEGRRLPALGWVLAAVSIGLWAGVFWYLSDSMARAAMGLLLVVLAALAWVGSRHERKAGTPAASGVTKFASLISIAMWLSAAGAGRWIAFY